MGRERRYPYLWGLTGNGQALFSCHQIKKEEMRMADEKTKVVTDATGPDADPVPVQPETGGGAPAPK